MRQLRDSLGEFLSAEDNLGSRQAAELRQAWRQVVPERLASHTGSVIYDKKDPDTVVVYTEGHVQKAELEAIKEYLRLGLSEALRPPPAKPIKELRFAIDRQVARQQAEARREQVAEQPASQRVEPLPLDAEEDRHARESVAAIADDELKQSLYKAMKVNMEWKKGKDASKRP